MPGVRVHHSPVNLGKGSSVRIGFSFAGGLYVQSLSRLASMGFRVLAVDLAGSGLRGPSDPARLLPCAARH